MLKVSSITCTLLFGANWDCKVGLEPAEGRSQIGLKHGTPNYCRDNGGQGLAGPRSKKSERGVCGSPMNDLVHGYCKRDGRVWRGCESGWSVPPPT